MNRIYMDHAATTPLHPEVIREMHFFMENHFGNPSSIHAFGREAMNAVGTARSRVANAIGAKAGEIFFTSGGTEADNLAILGTAWKYQKRGRHLITTAIEHPAVLEPLQHLAKQGFEVTILPVDEAGLVAPEDVRKAIKKDTILVSIMHANNEIGTIQPLSAISEFTRPQNILLHTDAVQSFGKIPVDVSQLGVDLLSLSAHKAHGPKGVGAIYLREGLRIPPIFRGGGQEENLRPGTENTIGIVGFGLAAVKAIEEMPTVMSRINKLKDKLINGINSSIPKARLNGAKNGRLPNNINFSFAHIEGESLVMSLDIKGIAGSSGSACSSRSLKASRTLEAIGLSHELMHGSLRLSLGRDNTEEEVDYVLAELPQIVANLRSFSPLA